MARHPQISYKEMAIESERLKSFKNWPLTKPTPIELSEAGFFYWGNDDFVCCFSCGVKIKDWSEQDDPWKGHAYFMHFANLNCRHLRLVKGDEFIKNQETYLSEPCDAISNTATISNTANIDESKICKICFNGECNTVFIPCGHVVSCGKCATSLSTCPLCNQPHANVIRIYFS